MNNAAYEKITDALITAMQGGRIPWHKPWRDAGGPMNAFSKKAYRGINLLILGLAEYGDPRWATYKQIQEHGGQVKRGEKSTPVVFWRWIEKEDDNGKDRIPFLRYYSVFNVEQAEGLELPPLADLIQRVHTPVEEAELIVNGYATKPAIKHGCGRAFYHPAQDYVGMPDADTFESAETYYSTLFHELIHSTGHVNRLNRNEVATAAAPFGSGDYSKEELTAEIGAAFLCNFAGLDNSVTMQNSTAYLQSWIKALQNDVRMAVAAAGRAQRAADYILGIKQEESDSEGTTAEPVAAQESSDAGRQAVAV